jgi:cytochrome d ubiquinol oxidase subunit I
VLAVVEVGLLFRYVKAGPGAVMPYADDPPPEPTERRDPAFSY